MGSEWKTVKFGDVLEVLTDYHANGSYKVLKQNVTLLDEPDYAIMIRTTNFEKNEFERSLKYITEDAYNFLRKSKVFFGDIIMNKIANAGSCYYIHDFKKPVSLAMNLFLLRIDPLLASSKYIFFNLKSNEAYVKNFAEGSVTKTITKAAVRNLDITLPPLPEQKAIAHILGTLEDKIELNRRMNATLEGMAQALFKSWFVDFDPVIDNAIKAGNPIPDELAPRAEVRRQALANGTANREAAKAFPDSFQETESMGWIPMGWDVSEIENATSTIIDHRGKTPKKLGHDWAESGFPAVSAKNIKDGKLVRKDTIRFTDTALYERWMAEELQKGDVLMTSEAPLGEKLYLAKQVKWVLSQRLFALRANAQISGVYLYHWLNTDIAKADIDGRASGTTVQGIRQSELRKVKVLAPTKDGIIAFSNVCDALMEKRAINEDSTEQLTKLRDTLLPKLISGELRIQEAKQLTKEAVA